MSERPLRCCYYISSNLNVAQLNEIGPTLKKLECDFARKSKGPQVRREASESTV